MSAWGVNCECVGRIRARVCGYSLAILTVIRSSLCSPTEMMETMSTSLPRFLQSFSEWLMCSALTITQEIRWHVLSISMLHWSRKSFRPAWYHLHPHTYTHAQTRVQALRTSGAMVPTLWKSRNYKRSRQLVHSTFMSPSGRLKVRRRHYLSLKQIIILPIEAVIISPYYHDKGAQCAACCHGNHTFGTMHSVTPPPAVTEPRPVVLLGAMEVDVRRYLVENGSNEDIKFSYCRRGMVRGVWCGEGVGCSERV